MNKKSILVILLFSVLSLLHPIQLAEAGWDPPKYHAPEGNWNPPKYTEPEGDWDSSNFRDDQGELKSETGRTGRHNLISLLEDGLTGEWKSIRDKFSQAKKDFGRGQYGGAFLSLVGLTDDRNPNSPSKKFKDFKNIFDEIKAKKENTGKKTLASEIKKGNGKKKKVYFHEGPPKKPKMKHDPGFKDGVRKPTDDDYDALAKWKAILKAAEIAGHLPDGTKAYRHFLEGKGKDRTFDLEGYYANDEAGKKAEKNAIIMSQKMAEKLCGNKTDCQMTSDAIPVGSGDPAFPYPATENWQKAIGAHEMWTSANVKVQKKKGKKVYTMELTIHVEDLYNFNPGAKDIKSGSPDEENGRFEETGLGHEYYNRGKVTRLVTWTEGDIKNTKSVEPESSKGKKDRRQR